MIRGDMSRAAKGVGQEKAFVLAARNASASLRDLEPRSVVRVTVLSARADGTTSVRIGDRTLIAAGLQRLVPGDSFDARVSVEGGAVLVTPLPERVPEGGAAAMRSLGIPDTPLSAFVISFFRTIGARVDPAAVRSVLASASRFRGKEFRAAEAAAILVERGIDPDDAAVARMIRVLEGSGSVGDSFWRDAYDARDMRDMRDMLDDSNTSESTASEGTASDSTAREGTVAGAPHSGGSIDSDDRDFCAFVNHKIGQRLHWIVIPFRKNIADVDCAGSLRVLIDLAQDRGPGNPPTPCRATLRCAALCRVTVLAASRDWDFSLTGDECSFAVNPAFPSVVFDQLVVYLKRWLAEAGITTVKAVESGEFLADGIKSIDLEI